jgi:hypothetical protein
MATSGRRWTVQDRDDHLIYLAEERWQHIVEANNHPEMEDYEDHLKTTIQQGHRRQEPLNPRKYRRRAAIQRFASRVQSRCDDCAIGF